MLSIPIFSHRSDVLTAIASFLLLPQRVYDHTLHIISVSSFSLFSATVSPQLIPGFFEGPHN
jgi:hypothetical protein